MHRVPLVLILVTAGLCAEDAREIVRKSVELDQTNWLRMKDYTWTARSAERHLDSRGQMKSEDREAWETLIFDGQPYRRMLERHGAPLSPAEQRKEQEKLDKSVAKLQRETPGQKQHRLAEYEKDRRREREFLREIPDAYDLRLKEEKQVDGRTVWVIAGTPRPEYRARTRDAKALSKIRGELWVDQKTYQWVRLEAETVDTISFGLFLARLNPGAKLVFEQARVNDDLWLPRRMLMRGTGRLGLVKKIAMEDEIDWSNYRKFQVDSRIVDNRE
ncbi:MAG: hypothetical protein U0Q18_20830 [Bryobacteraceae bacterium]